MTEVAPAPAAATAKTVKPAKKKAVKPKKSGPSVSELITKAVSASKERSGVSLAAVKKSLAAGGYDVDKNKARVKIAIKNLVEKGILVQVKGTGASGSFKIAKTAEKVKKPAVKKAAPKAKKPAAKKPVKSPKKKAAAKKTVAAKKSPAKAKKPAAKKPAAKKAAKSPKKAVKKPAAAKKPVAKKAAKPKAAKPKKAPKKK
uniref:histone H1-like n=1 Tax=Centroberyx gerrardi TaxID=166262 RepID=UPI003AAC371B